MRPSWKGLAAAAAILAAPVARAHDLRCEKTVDGQSVVHVFTYPKTVEYEWTITNTLTSQPSIATSVTDSMFDVDPPFTAPLTVNTSVSHTQSLEIPSYERCAARAGVEPNGEITLENVLTVVFDGANSPQECKAEVICHPPEQNGEAACLTRTPGYWGNHPEVARRFLPVNSCGEVLDTIDLKEGGSVIEDLCSIGRDKGEYDSPQEAQLVRQCAAAALNLAATEFLGGSCDDFKDIEDVEACCSSCGTVPAGCIETVDRFNNSKDTLLFEDKEINLCKVPALEIESCAADPDACKEAADNDFANDRDAGVQAAAVMSGATSSPLGPTSGGCSGGPGGVVALLGALGVLALRRRG